MRWIVRALLLLLVVPPAALTVGCEPVDDDDCPDDLLWVSPGDVCGETYCGEPVVKVGGGISGHEGLEEGQEVPIWYGTQGGYHLDISVEMDNLCPVVFLRPYFEVVPHDGGEPYEVFSQNRHVQAVRVEPDVSPRQQFWGIRAFVPCEHWPDDPDHDLECAEGRGSAGFLEDFDVIIGVEAWDHHTEADGETPTRYGHDSRQVDPSCCGGP